MTQPQQTPEEDPPNVQKILDEWGDDSLMFLDPKEDFDHCIVGVVERFGMSPVVLYDREKVIQVYVDQGMTEEEAEEYFDVNTIGAWVQERTPAFMTGISREEDA